MTALDSASVPADPDVPQPAVPRVFSPLLLWLALQLLCLGLSLGHIRFWANPPQALDHLALPELLVVQSIVSALLFPILFRTPLTALLVILSAWPFCQLAAFVSSTPARQWIAAAAALTGWMIALAIWRAILRTPLLERLGIALATALTIGAPLLLYLRAEFSPESVYTIPWSFAACFGPILSSLAHLQPGDFSLLPSWLVVAGHILLAGGALALMHAISRHRERAMARSGTSESPSPSP
jgi:hypothetical protein